MDKPIPFGKYYLLERINVGGMAEVFKAKTVGVEGFERIVALKRILPSIAEDEEFITMFIDEAKIAVQLQHANIAQIFDLGKVDDAYFIALEYVNGRDLRGIFDDLRKAGQRMPLAQVCYCIMQLCEGLDYAHNKRDAQGRELNLVHRDVSPQNVLLGYEGEVKLIDFGIAKAAGKASKTQAGILKGKFGYMSPEQVRGLPIDRRSDIFALGIVLYELLTGERLFIGESDFSTLEKVRNVEIVPPSSFNTDVPEKLERIVLKALEKNVEDRYQNAIDLHDDLQLFMHSVGQFASRKDLSAWMKRTFASDAAEADSEPMEFEEVEEIEEIDPDAAGHDTAELTESPTAAAKASAAAQGEEEFGWDEEEKETQIFDKDPAELDRQAQQASFLVEGGDKTVAMPPSEELLAEMGQAFEGQVPTQPTGNAALASGAAGNARQIHPGFGDLDPEATPLPPPTSFPSLAPQAQGHPRRSGTLPAVVGGEAALSPFDLPKPTFRQTLIGGAQAPGLPGSALPVARPFGTPAYPTYQPSPVLQQGLPAPTFQPSAFPGAPVLPQAPQFPASVEMYQQPPMAVRPPSHFRYYFAFVVFMILGGGGAYMFMTRPGKLQVAVRPADARLSVGGVMITSDPPFLLEKRPGVYRLSVSRPGYVTREQDVQIAAGQMGHVDIDLEPSSDTGFDLTSQPSGGLVWLDGQPLTVDEHGKQATTNFHASRIAPGPHVIEIKGNPHYRDWRQEFLQEPARTVRLHADLAPVGGAAKPVAPSKTPLAPTVSTPPTPPPSPSAPLLGSSSKGQAAKSERHSHRSSRSSSSSGSSSSSSTGGSKSSAAASSDEDVFENLKSAMGEKKPKPKPSGDLDDIFETRGKDDSGGSCVATISSKPWAEVSIDGKPTGKITPIVNYVMPCGKHRITFRNADLMIERNESVMLKAGQPFKKIFSLVDNDL